MAHKPCEEVPEGAPELCDNGHRIHWSKQETDEDQEVWLGLCLWCPDVVCAIYNGELIKK